MPWTARKMNKWVLEHIQPELKNYETEAALLWAHHEKTRFSEKHSNAEKG